MRNVPLYLRRSAAFAVALTTLCSVSLSAASVDNWTQNHGSLISDLNTNHPVAGNGTADSVKTQQMYAITPSHTLANVGDSLKFSGNANFIGDVAVGADQFRFGIYDSNGKAGTATPVNGWLGYFATNAGAGGGERRSQLWKRPDGNTVSYGSNGWANPKASAWAGTAGTVMGAAEYSFSMVLTKTADGINITWSLIGLGDSTYSINGNWLDTNPNATTFDRVGIFLGGGVKADRLLFSNIDLTFSPVIPEPATTAALAGLAVLGFVMLRRRFRR